MDKVCSKPELLILKEAALKIYDRYAKPILLMIIFAESNSTGK